MKRMALRQAIISEKDWLRKINRTKNIAHLRNLIAEATDKQIRTLQCIVLAHMDDQSIPIDSRSFKKLKSSRKLAFIRKYFSPSKTLGAIQEARKLILKIVSVIRLFTANVASSSPS